VRCWCEELVVADDDEALLSALNDHIAETHPDDAREEEEIRGRVEAKAYDPPDRPPWAY
jgi:hypothetical protein